LDTAVVSKLGSKLRGIITEYQYRIGIGIGVVVASREGLDPQIAEECVEVFDVAGDNLKIDVFEIAYYALRTWPEQIGDHLDISHKEIEGIRDFLGKEVL
jgi:hypothetical protein